MRTHLLERTLLMLALGGCGGATPPPASAASACAAEDIDGFEDDDGCLDPDDDGDGLLDTHDDCPRVASAERDGCPAPPTPPPDADGDRILDVDDACPLENEVFNGVNDEDGCPDRGYVTGPDEEILILDKVYFPRNAARPAAGQHADEILEAVAATLRAHPELTRIEIVGRAARGERNADALSLARATWVQEVLVAHGVAVERIPIIAVGTRDAHGAAETDRNVGFHVVQPEP